MIDRRLTGAPVANVARLPAQRSDIMQRLRERTVALRANTEVGASP
jgi:hypothetical protein